MAAPASSSTTRKIYESLSFLASTWPKDKLRPDVQFGGSILKAAERSLFAHTPTSAPPPQTSGSNGISTRIDSKAIEYATLNAEEESVAQSAIAALNSIKSGQASKKYPLPDSLARPASNPEYYIRLGKMLEGAAKGIDQRFTFKQRLRIFFGQTP